MSYHMTKTTLRLVYDRQTGDAVTLLPTAETSVSLRLCTVHQGVNPHPAELSIFGAAADPVKKFTDGHD